MKILTPDRKISRDELRLKNIVGYYKIFCLKGIKDRVLWHRTLSATNPSSYIFKKFEHYCHASSFVFNLGQLIWEAWIMNEAKYLDLRKWIYNPYSILAISAEFQFDFSSTGYLLLQRHNHLLSNIVENNVCLLILGRNVLFWSINFSKKVKYLLVLVQIGLISDRIYLSVIVVIAMYFDHYICAANELVIVLFIKIHQMNSMQLFRFNEFIENIVYWWCYSQN